MCPRGGSSDTHTHVLLSAGVCKVQRGEGPTAEGLVSTEEATTGRHIARGGGTGMSHWDVQGVLH